MRWGFQPSTSCLTRGSAHRHLCTRSTNSATTSSRVSRKVRRCTSASRATCRTSRPSTEASGSAAGGSAYLLSVEAEAVKDGKHLPVRLVYVRNKNKRSDYLVLVSTNLTLSEEEIIQTYGKRWNIEVFFKMCKSYLKRSISYDALTAHTAIVFARYMMLALEQRRNMDERSLGELFYLTIDELEDLHYLDALASLLSLLMDYAKEAEILDEEQINQLLNLFVAKLPNLWRGKCLKQCA